MGCFMGKEDMAGQPRAYMAGPAYDQQPMYDQ